MCKRLGILMFFLWLFHWGMPQNPWVGGLNACQFGRMDLDHDGKRDLLVFDRHGNRLLCYINKGGDRAIDYRYTTDYNEAFPRLTDWVMNAADASEAANGPAAGQMRATPTVAADATAFTAGAKNV